MQDLAFDVTLSRAELLDGLGLAIADMNVWRRTRRTRLGSLLVCFGVLGWGLWHFTGILPVALLTLALAVLAIAMHFALTPLAARAAVAMALPERALGWMGDARRVTLDDRGIRLDSDGLTLFCSWDRLMDVLESRTGLVLVLAGEQPVPLPARLFESPAAMAQLAAFCRGRADLGASKASVGGGLFQLFENLVFPLSLILVFALFMAIAKGLP